MDYLSKCWTKMSFFSLNKRLNTVPYSNSEFLLVQMSCAVCDGNLKKNTAQWVSIQKMEFN